jgi:hypothetical protein
MISKNECQLPEIGQRNVSIENLINLLRAGCLEIKHA